MHLCTVNVRHTLSCTRLSKITDKGEGVPHLRVAGRRAWARTWKGPLTFCIIYTKQQDKHFKHSFLKRKIDFESTQLARQVQPITGCLCCHTYCAQLRPPWATIVGVFRAVSNGEFRYPRVCWRFLSHLPADSPERLFSTSGNTMMTKKQCSLSCDNLEECVYSREAWPQVCKWAADKKVLDMD